MVEAENRAFVDKMYGELVYILDFPKVLALEFLPPSAEVTVKK